MRSTIGRYIFVTLGVWSLVSMAPRAGAIAVKTGSLDFDEADVSVTITARGTSQTPDDVLVGDGILYTALIHNAGPQPSQRVRLHIALPADVSFSDQTFGGPTGINGTSCSNPPWGEQGGSVACTIPALPAGVTTGIVVLVQALVAGEISSTVSISGADTLDPDPTNNSATVTVTVNTRQADVAVAITAAVVSATPDSVFVGDSLLYTALIHNAGPQPSQHVRRHNRLPPGLRFGDLTFGGPTGIHGTSCFHPPRGAEGGSVDCTIPALPPGDGSYSRRPGQFAP